MSTTTPTTQTKPVTREITAQVLTRLEVMKTQGEIKIPKDYSPENALKSAELYLAEMLDTNKKPVLESCTKDSIANALMKMVVQGLSVTKNQCYFIPYGDKLNYQRSYFGSIALAKRVANVSDVISVIIYEGDEFEFEIDVQTGLRIITKHKQSLTNIDNSKIIGCYCVVEFNSGKRHVEVMTIAEIQDAWNQGAAKGNSPAHKNFRQEMSKKVVINRALKVYINSSDDSHLYFEEDYPEFTSYEEVKKTEKEPIQLNPTAEVVTPIVGSATVSKNEPKAVPKEEKTKVVANASTMDFPESE